jgi:hypothetical protein
MNKMVLITFDKYHKLNENINTERKVMQKTPDVQLDISTENVHDKPSSSIADIGIKLNKPVNSLQEKLPPGIPVVSKTNKKWIHL